jgi:hypothetical protein
MNICDVFLSYAFLVAIVTLGRSIFTGTSFLDTSYLIELIGFMKGFESQSVNKSPGPVSGTFGVEGYCTSEQAGSIPVGSTFCIG